MHDYTQRSQHPSLSVGCDKWTENHSECRSGQRCQLAWPVMMEQSNTCWATSLGVFKIIRVMPRTLSGHTGVTSGVRSRKRPGKSSNLCRPNNPLLNFPCSEEETKRKIKNGVGRNGNEKVTHRSLRNAGGGTDSSGHPCGTERVSGQGPRLPPERTGGPESKRNPRRRGTEGHIRNR